MINRNFTIEELAAYISEYLKTKGVDVVLVGGACVSVYSKNAYISGDLDFITYHESKKVKSYLRDLGFIYTKSKYFIHEDTDFIIEFVNPPIAVGNEPVREFNIHKTNLGEVKLLTPTDTVKDRLSAYYHWDDEQSLEQALLVAREKDLDMENIFSWSKRENMLDKFEVFSKKI